MNNFLTVKIFFKRSEISCTHFLAFNASKKGKILTNFALALKKQQNIKGMFFFFFFFTNHGLFKYTCIYKTEQIVVYLNSFEWKFSISDHCGLENFSFYSSGRICSFVESYTDKFELLYINQTYITPPRTPRISRLKSQILKPTFLS